MRWGREGRGARGAAKPRVVSIEGAEHIGGAIERLAPDRFQVLWAAATAHVRVRVHLDAIP